MKEMKENKLCVHPGRHAEDMIEAYELKMGKASCNNSMQSGHA